MKFFIFIFRLSTKAKVYVISEKGLLSQESILKKINDIIEIDSYVFAVGEGGKNFLI